MSFHPSDHFHEVVGKASRCLLIGLGAAVVALIPVELVARLLSLLVT